MKKTHNFRLIRDFLVKAFLKLIPFFVPKLTRLVFDVIFIYKGKVDILSFRVLIPSSNQASLREWKWNCPDMSFPRLC